MNQIQIRYFAQLREQRGCAEETVSTSAETPADLYRELASTHGFRLGPEHLQVAVNDEFRDWNTPLADKDTVVFIAPVAGGG